jgi:hypothetical protein
MKKTRIIVLALALTAAAALPAAGLAKGKQPAPSKPASMFDGKAASMFDGKAASMFDGGTVK